jgi:hypothetical protein
VTDVFTSTDRKSHKLDLLWDNDQRFYEGTGDSTQIEYKFPGKSSYSTHVVNDVVSLPKSPGTIFIRMHGAPDGDTSTGRGAIVYDRPATAATFRYVDSSYEAFMLHQKVTVPAHGTTRLRFAVAQEYQAAKVAADARLATAVFAGCTVPNVVGKSLAAAKRAIKKAHCTVGRIKHASSSTIARGVVVAEQPAAGTHVDYGTKVAVIVSKG